VSGVSVARLFPGETIVCIGGGPSLTQADVDACRGKTRVIAVNDAYRIAPFADVLYACDEKWWKWHQGVPSFTGLKYGMAIRPGKYPDVQRLHGYRRRGTGTRSDWAPHRPEWFTGYQAINLAVHLGAARILLLGYDMQRGKPRRRTGSGTIPRFATHRMRVSLRRTTTLVKPLRELGIGIVNCSRETALTCFPRLTIDQALDQAVAA
jgi:hypothetical protein